MFRHTLILLVFLIGNFIYGQNFQWAKSYKLVYNDDRDGGEGIAINPSGQILMTGYRWTRMYIAKYTQSGTQTSTQEFKSNLSVKAMDISVDPNSDLYFTGHYDGTVTFGSFSLTSNLVDDAFIIKTDSLFNPLWVKSLGGDHYDQGQKIVTDDNGDVYVAGQMEGIFHYDSAVLQSRGLTDIFLAKYSSLGHLYWIRQLGGTHYDDLGAMKYHDGFIYLAGTIFGTATFDTITVLNDNETNVFTAKFNLDGHAIWVKKPQTYTAPGWGAHGGNGYAIAINNSGEVYVAGKIYTNLIFGNDTLYHDDLQSAFVARYDSLGNFLAAKKTGGLVCQGIEIGSDGGVYLTGYFNVATTFGNDTLWAWGPGWVANNVYIAKYTSDLNSVWAVRCGGDGYMESKDITLDQNDNIYVTGYYDTYTTRAVFYPYSLPRWGQESFITKLHDYCVGINQTANNQKNSPLYPNPCNDILMIKDPGEVKTFMIYDCSGSLLISKYFDKIENTIDISILKKGIYIVIIESKNGEKSISKLIKV